MNLSGSFVAYLVVLISLAAVILPLQAITRNGFIRGKLRFSLLVIVAAAAYEAASHYYRLEEVQPSDIGKL